MLLHHIIMLYLRIFFSCSGVVVGGRLYRSRSVPHIGLSNQDVPRQTCQQNKPKTPLVTLRQHYYPEGGWGWLVLAAGTLAHVLAHGLHQASGVLAYPAITKYSPILPISAGIYLIRLILFINVL